MCIELYIKKTLTSWLATAAVYVLRSHSAHRSRALLSVCVCVLCALFSSTIDWHSVFGLASSQSFSQSYEGSSIDRIKIRLWHTHSLSEQIRVRGNCWTLDIIPCPAQLLSVRCKSRPALFFVVSVGEHKFLNPKTANLFGGATNTFRHSIRLIGGWRRILRIPHDYKSQSAYKYRLVNLILSHHSRAPSYVQVNTAVFVVRVNWNILNYIQLLLVIDL